ncbi:hypothetical protein PGH45_18375 [Legionella pneumophila]|nr:hypothetical protein [Legionella pneumophila]
MLTNLIQKSKLLFVLMMKEALQKEITGKVFFAEGEIAKSMGEYALSRFGKS